jgi:peptidoglycan/LPS O-acetylase OafA/YrhL
MPDGETLAANLTLSQNLLRTESYPAVLWSLPFEVQMYLALPLLFLLVRGASWYRPFAFWVVSVAALVVLRLTGLTLLTDLFSYVPCFLAGIMAYRLTDRQAHVLPFIGWPVSIVACVGIRVVAEVSGLYAPTKWSPWLACLWLAVSLPLFRELSWVPLKTAAHLIAKFSYGIYLSHLAVFWFAFFWIQDAGMATRVLICIGLSVTIPIILYYAIEQPLIRAGIRLTTIKRVAVRTAEAHQRLAFTKSESTSVTSYFPAQR